MTRKKTLPSIDADIRLYGSLDDDRVRDFLEQLDKVKDNTDPCVFELTTIGGDADAGRRIALEVRLFHQHRKKEMYFLGKTVVYSAGAVIMAAFPQPYRFVTRDTMILVHDRHFSKEASFSGSLDANIQNAREILSLLEAGKKMELEGFEELAKGTKLTAEEIKKRAHNNWYIAAEEALELGLVAGVV